MFETAFGETVTLARAAALVRTLAPHQSLLLLAPPGVGKSDTVAATAATAGLECRSLLGTQIAPEDVSGIPRIVGERAVFCPLRVLLPDDPKPFCLFLDELPAAGPDVQKAMYSLLLERRIGEHRLPPGTWVVAAGNRAEDRALVRGLSSALVNRVIVLRVRADPREWQGWAKRAGVRAEVRAFLAFLPAALMRDVPSQAAPFSTPRGWANLGDALNRTEAARMLDCGTRRALAFGAVSGDDAAVFCAVAEAGISEVRPAAEYVKKPTLLPGTDTALWFVLWRVRHAAAAGELAGIRPKAVNAFLRALPTEHRAAVLLDLVGTWADLGGERALLETLHEVVGE